MTTPATDAPTRQLLEWLADGPRTYADVIDAWRTSCPRLSVWEDAVGAGLVEQSRGEVRLSHRGREVLQDRATV
jgi:hypothetical protein